uniref:Uncharacterized protein n=1 Tax=uncultured bacterium A1Q1_fos_2067 TaxID=1256560 RepID=L7VUF8_9BACT|nr:hypothetical protein [uncultured bacterium A1Q1_fos_2067]
MPPKRPEAPNDPAGIKAQALNALKMAIEHMPPGPTKEAVQELIDRIESGDDLSLSPQAKAEISQLIASAKIALGLDPVGFATWASTLDDRDLTLWAQDFASALNGAGQAVHGLLEGVGDALGLIAGLSYGMLTNPEGTSGLVSEMVENFDLIYMISEGADVGIATWDSGAEGQGKIVMSVMLAILMGTASKSSKFVSETPLPVPPGSPGRVVANALESHELSFANDIVGFRGGTLTGAPTRYFPGIDGALDGVPISLKQTKGGLGSVLKNASKAEAQAKNAGYSGVEVFIEAKNVDKTSLLDFAEKGPLAKIPSQGTVSSIHVLTADGWVRISGR